MATDCTGFGVVEWSDQGHAGSREPCLVALASGGIRLPKGDTMPRKLAFVYRELMLLLAAHAPEVVAIEEVFYSANVKSALKLGQVRGVALLAAANCGLPVAEYAPLKIKSSVVGYGLAQKEQSAVHGEAPAPAGLCARASRRRGRPRSGDLSFAHAAQTLVAQVVHCARIPQQRADALMSIRGVWRIGAKGWQWGAASALVIAGLGSSSGQSALPVEVPASGSTACVEFHYENPQLQPAKYRFIVDESGVGHFHSEPGPTPPPDTAGYHPLPDSLDRPLLLSKNATNQIFAIARAQKYFAISCEDSRNKVAFQGTKQLSYRGVDGSGSCTYNWSRLPSIQRLTSMFESIAFTLEEGPEAGNRTQARSSRPGFGAWCAS